MPKYSIGVKALQEWANKESNFMLEAHKAWCANQSMMMTTKHEYALKHRISKLEEKDELLKNKLAVGLINIRFLIDDHSGRVPK